MTQDTREGIDDAVEAARASGGIRLVVADMDGTLLDADGRVPETFWPLLERMRAAGVVFAPASGRQHATLARLFSRASGGMPIIAENGTYVARDDAELSSTPLDRETVVAVTERVRELAHAGHDLGIVVCGTRSAHVERGDEAFLSEVRTYYASLAITADVLEADDEVIKLAIFSFDDAEAVVAPALAAFGPAHQVVVSGEHWIDVMDASANKGAAVRALAAALGIGRGRIAAFGDYLNDLEMLDEAGLSFAMENAHPEVRARARFLAPSNAEDGVVTTLERLLDAAPGARE